MAGMRTKYVALFGVLTGCFVVIQFINFGQFRDDRSTINKMSDASDGSLRKSNPTTSQSIRIAACTCVRNDLPYILEWIEYYRIQGFEKFWIFNDLSTDNIELLEELYDNKFPGKKFVEVFKHETPGHQPPAYTKCQEMALAQGIDWVGVMDTDEFWYSPAYGTVAKFIESKAIDPTIGHIGYTQIRFGTSGQIKRFSYSLEKVGGSVILKNPSGVQLITQTHIRRGPYEVLGEPAKNLSDSIANCSKPARDGWMMCYNGNGDHKSMWRADAPIGEITPHSPKKIQSNYRGYSPDVNELRGNHYYYRSIDDAKKKSIDWKKPDPLDGVMSVDSYWNLINDVGILRFVPELEKAMQYLLE